MGACVRPGEPMKRDVVCESALFSVLTLAFSLGHGFGILGFKPYTD